MDTETQQAVTVIQILQTLNMTQVTKHLFLACGKKVCAGTYLGTYAYFSHLSEEMIVQSNYKQRFMRSKI